MSAVPLQIGLPLFAGVAEHAKNIKTRQSDRHGRLTVRSQPAKRKERDIAHYTCQIHFERAPELSKKNKKTRSLHVVTFVYM